MTDAEIDKLCGEKMGFSEATMLMWYPTYDIEQAMMLEEDIISRNLTREYEAALTHVVQRSCGALMALIHASPRERCLAYLKARGVEVRDA